jgi:hypothetical protein
MTRDTSVGAVCARTYPQGEGPLYWYQQFEYAIGHWFQKVTIPISIFEKNKYIYKRENSRNFYIVMMIVLKTTGFEAKEIF